jgi:hypothetical protein
VRPRIRVSGISGEMNEATLLTYLSRQNECVFEKKILIEASKINSLKKQSSIFCALFEVDISTYKKAPSVRHCLIGLDSCTIYDAVEVI